MQKVAPVDLVFRPFASLSSVGGGRHLPALWTPSPPVGVFYTLRRAAVLEVLQQRSDVLLQLCPAHKGKNRPHGRRMEKKKRCSHVVWITMETGLVSWSERALCVVNTAVVRRHVIRVPVD